MQNFGRLNALLRGVIIPLLLFPVLVLGRQDRQDSLYRALSMRWQDSIEDGVYSNLPRAKCFLDSLGWLASRLAADSNWVDYRVGRGKIVLMEGKIDEALQDFEVAFQLAYRIDDSVRLSEVFYCISKVYAARGDYIACLSALRSALQFLTPRAQPVFQIELHNMLAVVYYYNHYFDRAIDYFREAEQLSIAFKRPVDQAIVCMNMGALFLKQQKLFSALESTYRGCELLKNNDSPDSEGIKIFLYTLAVDIYSLQGYPRWARLYLDKSDAILRSQRISAPLYDNSHRQYYLHRATYYYRAGLLDSALDCCAQFLAIERDVGPTEQDQQVLKLQAMIHMQRRDWSRALEFYERYWREIDSINLQRNPFRIADYELSTQRKEYMQRMSEERLSAKQEQQEQERRSNLIVGTLCLVIFFLVVFVRIMLFYNRRNRMIYLKISESAARLQQEHRRLSKRQQDLEYQSELLVQNNMLLLQAQRMHEYFVGRVDASLTFVRTLQCALHPTPAQLLERVGEHFVLYLPRDSVSGDFYWCTPPDSPSRIVALVDCAGHGIPGALLSMIGNMLLRKIVLEFGLSDPGEIVNCLHDQVRNYLVVDRSMVSHISYYSMDLSVVAYDPASHRLRFCGANSQLFVSARGEVKRYKGSMISVGSLYQVEPFQSMEIDIPTGERVCFYLTSDGFADQLNLENRKFGNVEFKRLLQRAAGLSMDAQHIMINEAFQTHRMGCDQTDDVCVMGFCVPV